MLASALKLLSTYALVWGEKKKRMVFQPILRCHISVRVTDEMIWCAQNCSHGLMGKGCVGRNNGHERERTHFG